MKLAGLPADLATIGTTDAAVALEVRMRGRRGTAVVLLSPEQALQLARELERRVRGMLPRGRTLRVLAGGRTKRARRAPRGSES